MADSEIFNDSPTAAEQCEPEQPESEKRNCGRTGPTSPEGRAASSKNAIKHGACARTLILPHESEEDWELLLAHWCETYKPAEDSLEYDFVLRTAQAEWHRRRTQFNFDVFMASTEGGSSINWRPEQIKQYDLALRYKTSAERSFQREYRLLEQFYKARPPKPAEEPAARQTVPQEPEAHNPEAKERDFGPPITFTVEDPASPTGFTEILTCYNGREYPGPASHKYIPGVSPTLPPEARAPRPAPPAFPGKKRETLC